MAATENGPKADLVFEGGGVKGIGLAGAWCHLAGKGYVAERVAGTSAGAITAAMVAAGLPADDLRRLVLEEIAFARFEDGGGLPWSEPLELLRRKGLHPGRYFEGWMREQLSARGISRFGDLRLPDAGADENGVAHRLQVVASDVSCHRMLVLPRDARHLGVEPDDLEVARAVRMSMSIPVFFDPVVAEGPGKAEHVVVDGGLLSNFPVWLFDAPPGQAPRWPTFGFLLVAPGQRNPLGGPPADQPGEMSLPDYAMAIVHTVLEAHDRLYLEQADFARTITIDTLGVQTTQFSIDHDGPLKQKLFASGEAAAAAFLQSWDFEGYKRAFRVPAAAPPSRRERVAQVMAAAR
jgi:NTE family protein